MRCGETHVLWVARMDDLWHKARTAADDARFLYQAGRHESACSRAYYAMLNAARVLLEQKGVDTDRVKRHTTVLQLFSLHFVKSGPFDSSLGHALGEAGRARVQVDYSRRITEPEMVADVIAALEKFMEIAEQLVREEEKREEGNP